MYCCVYSLIAAFSWTHLFGFGTISQGVFTAQDQVDILREAFNQVINLRKTGTRP